MLTDAFLRNAPQGYHWDTKLKGFGVRVGKNRTTFLALVASGSRKSLGVYPHTSLADARIEAKRLLAQKTLKIVSRERVRTKTAISDFLSDCQKRLRPKTVEDYERQLRNLKLSGYLHDITQREIIRQLNTLTPSNKEHATRVGKTFFTWCRRQGFIDTNPMELLQAPVGRSRERILTDQELAEVYQTALKGTDSYSRLLVFLILTGQRRGEASMLQWEWIDEQKQLITFPSYVTKNKREHSIPSAPLVSSDHNRSLVFCGLHGGVLAGWSKFKLKFDRQHTVRDYTLHDLRRTFSSGLARLNVPIHITEKILNHTSGTHSGVQATYNRYSYIDEMRDALEKWERNLASLTQ